jgi:hypothetical protein
VAVTVGLEVPATAHYVLNCFAQPEVQGAQQLPGMIDADFFDNHKNNPLIGGRFIGIGEYLSSTTL